MLHISCLALVGMAVWLNAMVVTVMDLCSMRAMLSHAGVADEVGERTANALHRQHGQRENEHEPFGTV